MRVGMIAGRKTTVLNKERVFVNAFNLVAEIESIVDDGFTERNRTFAGQEVVGDFFAVKFFAAIV